MSSLNTTDDGLRMPGQQGELESRAQSVVLDVKGSRRKSLGVWGGQGMEQRSGAELQEFVTAKGSEATD